MEEARKKMRASVQYVIGNAEHQFAEHYDAYELHQDCGLTVFRGTYRKDGGSGTDIFRFDKDGNSFDPASLGQDMRRSWVRKLYQAKQSPEKIMLFMDMDLNMLERDFNSL